MARPEISMTSLMHSFRFENPLRSRFGEVFFKKIPDEPGVYFMLGPKDRRLYIGKAKSLRKRLRFYANARPGAAPERILEMIESVERIRWEVHASEKDALARESELLHALRPPFNIAGVEEEHYLFIGVRAARALHLDFQLSSREEIREEGYVVYGCFKHRAKMKLGYTALHRLIHACLHEQGRFCYPARITRASPPWLHSAPFPEGWHEALDRFLSGRSDELLRLVMERLLENTALPRFMYPSLQQDLEVVQGFYRLGPRATYELRTRHGLRTRIVSHRRMDKLTARSVPDS